MDGTPFAGGKMSEKAAAAAPDHSGSESRDKGILDLFGAARPARTQSFMEDMPGVFSGYEETSGGEQCGLV